MHRLEGLIAADRVDVMPGFELPPWVPVLLTGGRRAQWVALASRLHPAAGAVTTIDCAECDGRRFEAALHAGRDALLLLDVDALESVRQAQLFEFLTRRAVDAAPRSRTIAASSLRLFELVSSGLFREDLFYCLNVIHLMLE
jgi:hypothetical protein